MRDLKGKPWNGIEIQVLRGKSIEQSLSYVGHDFICGLSLMDTSPLAAMCVCEGIAGRLSPGCIMLDNTVWASQTWLPKWGALSHESIQSMCDQEQETCLEC